MVALAAYVLLCEKYRTSSTSLLISRLGQLHYGVQKLWLVMLDRILVAIWRWGGSEAVAMADRRTQYARGKKRREQGGIRGVEGEAGER